MRLRRRFAAAFLVVALVLSVTTLVGYTLYRDAVVDREQTDLARTSESVATQLDVVFAEKRRTVDLWAENDPLAWHGEVAQRASLATFVRQTGFNGASVIAANGTMTAIYARGLNASDEAALVGREYDDRTYFRRAMAGETSVSDPVDADSGFFIVTVSTPVEASGGTVGTLNAAFHLRNGDLSGIVRSSSTKSSGVSVTADGRTVFNRGPSPGDADAELVANATVASTGWTVGATSTRKVVGSNLWTVSLLQVGAVALVLVSLAGFGAWLYREFVGNVERLLDGFDSLLAGEYGTRVVLSGASEWTRVESQFNELSETLSRRQSEVTVLNRVLRHNLRNAMTVVVGNADRIAAETDDEDVAANAHRIRRRGESLLGLADHARGLESSLGDRPDESAARPVATVVEEVETVLRDEFPAARVTIDADGVGDALVARGDLLVVVLDELARNAVIHNDAGSPQVGLTATSDEDSITVVVSDDGPGIPPLERRVLTEPFVETQTRHGSGLGLWLVTWLVTRMDGDVDATVDGGTRVTVTVPQVSPDASGDADADAAATDD